MTRKHIHTRRVSCDAYYLEDGLWEIEGRLADVKSHEIRLNDGRHIPEGYPIHEMLVRMVIDDSYQIKSIDIETPNTPTFECPYAAEAYQNLIGVIIGKGFNARVHEIVKRENGCTHLTEVFRQMATTVFQAVPIARSQLFGWSTRGNGTDSGLILLYKDTCYALRSSSPTIRKSELD